MHVRRGLGRDMIPKNEDAGSDDLPNEDDYSELTDGELEEFASVLIEALTLPPQATGSHSTMIEGGAVFLHEVCVRAGIDTRQ